jgi:hypothetical protein
MFGMIAQRPLLHRIQRKDWGDLQAVMTNDCIVMQHHALRMEQVETRTDYQLMQLAKVASVPRQRP